jgi:hypothetical protein
MQVGAHYSTLTVSVLCPFQSKQPLQAQQFFLNPIMTGVPYLSISKPASWQPTLCKVTRRQT